MRKKIRISVIILLIIILSFTGWRLSTFYLSNNHDNKEEVDLTQSDPYPSNITGVSTDLSELSVQLNHDENQTMDYTIETSLDIGSTSQNGVGNGTYNCSVSGLNENTTYNWYVNVTDGSEWNNKSYSFKTVAENWTVNTQNEWIYHEKSSTDITINGGNLGLIDGVSSGVYESKMHNISKKSSIGDVEVSFNPSVSDWMDYTSTNETIVYEESNDAVILHTPNDDSYWGEHYNYSLISTRSGRWGTDDMEEGTWKKVCDESSMFEDTYNLYQIDDVTYKDGLYYMTTSERSNDFRVSPYVDYWNTNHEDVEVYDEPGTRDGCIFFHDEESKWYYVREDPENEEVDADTLEYMTASEGDFGNFQLQGTFVNPPFPTGDPDLIQLNDRYYLALDNDTDGGYGEEPPGDWSSYCIDLMWSDNLTGEWSDPEPFIYGDIAYQDPSMMYDEDSDKFYIYGHQMTGTHQIQEWSIDVGSATANVNCGIDEDNDGIIDTNSGMTQFDENWSCVDRESNHDRYSISTTKNYGMPEGYRKNFTAELSTKIYESNIDYISLSTTETTQYEFTINIEGNGTTDPAEGTHTFEEGTVATVEATSGEGWEFIKRVGDVITTDTSINITMDANKSITAGFEEKEVFETYNLTINIERNETVMSTEKR